MKVVISATFHAMKKPLQNGKFYSDHPEIH